MPEKERVRPLLEGLSRGIFDFGEDVGAALAVELCGNFLVISAGLAMSEALSLAKEDGLDPLKVIEMLMQALFSGLVYQSYGKMIALESENLTANWIAQKDIGLFTPLLSS